MLVDFWLNWHWENLSKIVSKLAFGLLLKSFNNLDVLVPLTKNTLWVKLWTFSTEENWWKRTGFNANWIDLKIHTYLLNLTDETINEKMYNRSRDLIWNFFLQITTFFSPLFRDTNNVYELGCELYWKTISWCSSHWYR